MSIVRGFILSASCCVALISGCGDDDDDRPAEEAGTSCASADQCYPMVEGDLTGGEAVCMDRVPGGYCTHFCSSDADCCAVEGECRTNLSQVCAPFESTGMMFCFLSCETADVEAAGVGDESEYCHRFAHSSFSCRSTGGGSENRKVCVP